VVELDAPNDGSLLNIGVNIIQAFLNSLLQVLSDSIKSEGTQASQGESSDLMIVHLLDVHPEGVNGKDCKFLVLLSVINEVEIYHLLHDNILSARGLDHLRV
jgi:hypothetical protein